MFGVVLITFLIDNTGDGETEMLSLATSTDNASLSDWLALVGDTTVPPGNSRVAVFVNSPATPLTTAEHLIVKSAPTAIGVVGVIVCPAKVVNPLLQVKLVI